LPICWKRFEVRISAPGSGLTKTASRAGGTSPVPARAQTRALPGSRPWRVFADDDKHPAGDHPPLRLLPAKIFLITHLAQPA
jgi:hypothetical protein